MLLIHRMILVWQLFHCKLIMNMRMRMRLICELFQVTLDLQWKSSQINLILILTLSLLWKSSQLNIMFILILDLQWKSSQVILILILGLQWESSQVNYY